MVTRVTAGGALQGIQVLDLGTKAGRRIRPADYADGVVGGTVPYEIDQTGFGIWALWDHYEATKDRTYLLSVYEAIQRSAHYLTDNPPLGCRDPATGVIAPVAREPRAWTDSDVEAVLVGMLRAIDREQNPAADAERPIALRGPPALKRYQ